MEKAGASLIQYLWELNTEEFIKAKYFSFLLCILAWIVLLTPRSALSIGRTAKIKSEHN